MDSSKKKKLRTVYPGRPPKRTNQTRRLDVGTIILAFAALILLILVIFFMRQARNAEPKRLNDAQPPIVKRVESPAIRTEPVEPILELGKPRAEENSVESAKPPPVTAEVTGQDKARLFFIKFIDEKKIVTKSVLRGVSASKSPMTVALNALLEGPKAGELSSDVFTLIPKDSRLLGARVESGIAFLNFNEEFRFNTLGIDGYQAQVEQIVYTATEFATVDKVQILVEGQRVDYLGGEGFWVGAPLGREDFD